MNIATLSKKYQIVIPKDIRERANLKPGQKLQFLVYAGRVELIPLRPLRELRGFLEGIDTDVPRDPDRL